MVTELLDCTPQEREWLEGCRKANPKAQEKIFKRYYSLLYGICIRYLSSKEIAQEVINDCFLKLFHQLESAYRYPEYFRSWLRQLAVHTAIDAYRKEKQKQYFTANTIDYQVLEVGCQETVNDTLNAEQILGLLAQLPDLWRLTFNLYEIEGYSHEEIAQLLNIPVSSSRVYLARAKQRLRELLRQHDPVRTYMPIYYLSSTGRTEDPDWAHFRETLYIYEPAGDSGSWYRFQRAQRHYHQIKWWQTGRLIVLVIVTLVCKKSQAPDPFYSKPQSTVLKSKMTVTSTKPKLCSDDEISRTMVTDAPIYQVIESTAVLNIGRKLGPKTYELGASAFPLLSNKTRPNAKEKVEKESVVYRLELDNKLDSKEIESSSKSNISRLSEKTILQVGTTTIRSIQAKGFRRSNLVISGSTNQFSKARAGYRHSRINVPSEQTQIHTSTKLSASTNKQPAIESTSVTEFPTFNKGLQLTLNKLVARPFLFSQHPQNLTLKVKPLVINSSMAQPVKRQFNVGLMVGSQIVYATLAKPSVSATGGMWTDLQVSRKLAIETGLIVAHSQISMTGKGVVSQDSANRWELLQQTQQWWTMTLPLTVRYTILSTHRLNWWVALGVSSAATFGEKHINDYRVSSLTGNPADSSQHVNSYTMQTESSSASMLLQPFRWVTMSSGIRVMTLGKHEWWLEPYFNYPIGSVTSESLRISTAGIRLKLRFIRFN